jgi:chitosanase
MRLPEGKQNPVEMEVIEPDDMGRREFLAYAAGLAATLALAACSGGEAGSPGERVTAGPSAAAPSERRAPAKELGLRDPVSLRRAGMVISTFENGTTEIRYDYAENIDDGRGITAGRAGFCSGTGDMLLVVEAYTRQKPGNPLARYLPRLQAIDRQFAASHWRDPVSSTAGLDGLENAWRRAAGDRLFRAAQDAIFDKLYLEPAIKRAMGVKLASQPGITSAVGQLIILDTLIQHGEGADPDGLPAIMVQAATTAGRSATERAYLDTFLDVRQRHLEHAADPDTRLEWAESVGRVKALRQLLASGNPDLHGRLIFDVYEGDHYDIPAA